LINTCDSLLVIMPTYYNTVEGTYYLPVCVFVKQRCVFVKIKDFFVVKAM